MFRIHRSTRFRVYLDPPMLCSTFFGRLNNSPSQKNMPNPKDPKRVSVLSRMLKPRDQSLKPTA